MKMHPLLLVVLGVATFAEAQTVGMDAVKVEYLRARGAQVSFDDVPVFRSSSLQLYAPGWSAGYYSSNGHPPRVERRDDAIVATHIAQKAKFTATETIKPAGENRIEITLAGKLDDPAEARLEWAIGHVNAWTLYGGAVAADKSESLAPILPEPSTAREAVNLVGESAAVRLQSRLGRIVVRVEKGPASLTILDGRRAPARAWARDEPTLWLGLAGVPLKAGEPFELRVSIEFTPRKKPGTFPDDLSFEAPAEAIEQAYLPTTRPVQIIPRPRTLAWRDGSCPLGPTTAIVIDDELQRVGAEVLRREVENRFGWGWRLVRVNADGESPPRSINFGQDISKGAAPQRYRIDVSPGGVGLFASDAAGYRYAAQTLLQMIAADKQGAFVRCARGDDGPSLDFRGVHFFPGRDSVDFYRRLCERVLARFKFNHVVLECEYTQWDANKQMWIKESVPKDQLAQYVKISRDNGLEPIPLVQSLGHMEWMFKNGANRELAEDPDQPYAYAVTEPKTYDFIHGVFAEATELFNPVEYLHIGHDEVDMRGRYPHRPEAKELGKTKLFVEDVKRHDDFFRPKGAKLMLWGDMLLSREQSNDNAAHAESREVAKERRDAIPKDVVIADWHYSVAKPADYKSLKLFKDEGFRTLACTWYTPENIRNFADAARMYGAWGLLQTTWAGYHITEETLDRDPKQFAAYVLAAEYAWSADSPPPDQLPWRAERVLADAMHPRKEAATPLPGTLIKFGGEERGGLGKFLGYADLSALPEQERIDGVRFDVKSPLTLTGRLLSIPTQHVAHATIETTDAHARELAFLHATAFRAAAGAEVARYEIAYADGMVEKIPLRYGREIRAWDDVAPAVNASDGWFGKTKSGVPVAVRVFRWTNPHAEKPIKSILLATEHPYASATLFGVTALADAPGKPGG